MYLIKAFFIQTDFLVLVPKDETLVYTQKHSRYILLCVHVDTTKAEYKMMIRRPKGI